MPTLAEIQKQIAELQKQELEIINQQKQSVVEKIKSEIATYHLTAEDLGFNSKGKRASKPKEQKEKVVMYRMNDIEWSGRGRMPQAFKELVEKNGKTALDKYKVQPTQENAPQAV